MSASRAAPDAFEAIRDYVADGEAPDGPLDLESRALLQALEELDDIGRAWDESLHPRGPGGRFASIVDRLKTSISEHHAGGGKGHPFDGYSREQLRRVAKKRGLELTRGESRDSISEKLLGHLKSSEPHAPAPVKSEHGFTRGDRVGRREQGQYLGGVVTGLDEKTNQPVVRFANGKQGVVHPANLDKSHDRIGVEHYDAYVKGGDARAGLSYKDLVHAQLAAEALGDHETALSIGRLATKKRRAGLRKASGL